MNDLVSILISTFFMSVMAVGLIMFSVAAFHYMFVSKDPKNGLTNSLICAIVCGFFLFADIVFVMMNISKVVS